MNRLVKRLVKSLLATSPGWSAAGWLRRRGVLVLMYHRIGDGDGLFPSLDTALFADQMRWLRARCHPLSPSDLRDSHLTSERGPTPALVTFDDGYRDYHDNAYPILRELGIPALVFLATSFMDKSGLLWTDQVHLAVRRSRRERVELPWGGPPRPLAGAPQRAEVTRICKQHLKSLPDAERSQLIPRLFEALGIDETDLAVPRQMLDWNEVRATRELTTFGGHTHTHPILSRLSPAEQDSEVRLCRDRIAAETGTTPTHFAYPNGRPVDFDAETRAALGRHGFDTAYTTVEGLNGRDTDWMAIRRIPGSGIVSDFAWLSSGFWKG